MADGLDISGGTTSVFTEDLECAIEQLGRLSRESGLLAARLARLDAPGGGGFDADQSLVDIEVAARNLEAMAQRSSILQVLLATAARGYEYQEAALASGVNYLGSVLAQVGGKIFPAAALTYGASVWLGLRLQGGVNGVMDQIFTGHGVPKGSPWARKNNELVNNPAVATAVRGVAQNLGPFLFGAGAPLGLPYATGTAFYQGGARALVGLGRSLDILHETPVRLVSTSAQPVTTAPEGFFDRLERVPYVDNESGPQVVIERYTTPGEADRFSVYVTGTVTFTPGASSEPWDMTSNIMNATGELSGSVASVRAAMEAAGVDSNSPVQLTGYSQGGGVVASVAASGGYNLQGLVSFGGPTGQIPLPPEVPTVLVEHSDDLVPSTGGQQSNTAAVLVRRDVFGGEPIPERYVVPSHHIEYYLETARLMETADSPQLNESLEKLNAFTQGATLVSSTAYRFEREG